MEEFLHLPGLPIQALQLIMTTLPRSDRKRLACTCTQLHEVVKTVVTTLLLSQQDLERWADEALTAFPYVSELQLVDIALGRDCVLALISTSPAMLQRLISLQVTPTHLDAQALLQLASCCPQLSELCVIGPWAWEAGSSSLEAALSAGAPPLRRLSLQHNSSLDTHQLLALLSQLICSNKDSPCHGDSLQGLTTHTNSLPAWCRALSSCCGDSGATDSSITPDRVAPTWPQLTALDLSASPKVGASLAFLWLCPALLSLTLHSCFKVTDSTLQELSTALSAANSTEPCPPDGPTVGLGGGNWNNTTDNTTRNTDGARVGTGAGPAASTGQPESVPLQHLDLSYTRVKDTGMRHLAAALPNLSCLGLRGCNVGDDGLLHLLQLQQLTALHIKHCHRVTEEGIQSLSKLSLLRSLSYGYTSMPEADEVAACIGQQFKALTGLDLLASELTDAGLAALGALKQLQQLKLYQAGVTAEGLMALAGQPAGTGLQSLVLYGTGALRELSCLGEFASLHQLQLGRLCDLEVSMALALQALTATQALTSLTLERMDDLTVGVLQDIMRGCRQLQLLRVRGCDGVCLEDMEDLAVDAAAVCSSSACICWAASPSCDTDDEEDGWQFMEPC